MPTRQGTSRITLWWRQVCCLPGHLCLPCSTGRRPPGSSHLDAPPSLPAQLKQMHEDLLQHYVCTDQPAAAQPATVWCRRQHCCKCRHKPAASTSRLPRQLPRQTCPSSAQPPPRRIQAESGFPPGVLQLSGPAAHSSAQTHSVATPPHAVAHQALAPIQGLASALH
jgi:hypothetical protein